MSESEDVWSLSYDSEIADRILKNLPKIEGSDYKIKEPIPLVERLKKMRTRPGVTRVGTNRRKYNK